MDELDGTINYLLGLNQGSIPKAQKDANMIEVSTYRESYFAFMDQKEEVEKQLQAVYTRQMQERADEFAADAKELREKGEQAEFDSYYNEKLGSWKEFKDQVEDVQQKLDKYSEALEEATDEKSIEKWEIYVDLYGQQLAIVETKFDAADAEYQVAKEDKRIREEQLRAEQAKQAKDREYQDQLDKMNNGKAILDGMRAAATAAEARYTAVLEESGVAGAAEAYEEWQDLLIDIGTETALQAEIKAAFDAVAAEKKAVEDAAREQKQKDEKNYAYTSAQTDSGMFADYAWEI